VLLVEKQGIFYNVINQKRQQPDSNSKRKGELIMKKKLCLAMTMAMVVSLAGCGGGGASSDSGASDNGGDSGEGGVSGSITIWEHDYSFENSLEQIIAGFQEEVDEKNRQRMKALSAQLTPHFIYNALNTPETLISSCPSIRDCIPTPARTSSSTIIVRIISHLPW